MHKHFIRTNDNIIVHAFSDAFEQPIEGDICINENGDRHYHLNIFDINNHHRYKYEDGWVVERTIEEKETIAWMKDRSIINLGDLSFEKRQEIVPDYKITNVNLGVIYSENNNGQYLNTIEAFRTEFYRVKDLIDNAVIKEEIETILDSINFPTALIQ